MVVLSNMMASIIQDYDIRRASKEQDWQYEARPTAVAHSWPAYIAKASSHFVSTIR
ncbi:hypothetical protein BKA67DRAFT_561218 [Truncatella angustata]|uniref:Uncharacterized protein n=1 Tax=Truncatella angustata TaxID=152316 RepID=A0A9P8UP03_9PEZI|nr:uncharacterized protein BKA67DRAFT_561218 [Truncatella angustata]KAH6655603.1 hypothetical protein BKA67DRAFT_561218 [Truncatella angustata]